MSSNNSTLDAAIQRARHGQQALSKLFQACDLLSAALTHSDGDNGPEELAARTLTKGALSRIESAVSELDNVVPHPAEASGLPVAESWDDIPDRKATFEDEHYIVLRGIVRAARDVFREINEPEDLHAVNQSASQASCVLLALAERLEKALGEGPGGAA